MRMILLAIVLAAASPAFAADTSWPPPAPSTPKNPDYEAAQQALKANDYGTAIARLERAARSDPNNANVQNLLGYAYRKSGNYDLAFRHYEEALRLDPGHRGAHEYIGETYLLVGNLAKAEEHLAALDRLCRFSCEEYRDLKEAIERYKREHASK